MMRRIVLERGQRLTDADLARSGGVDAEILGVAAGIVEDVRLRGDEAVRDYTAKFDKVELDSFRVTRAEIDAAVELVSDEFKDAISVAAGAIEDFHARQVPQSWFTVSRWQQAPSRTFTHARCLSRGSPCRKAASIWDRR